MKWVRYTGGVLLVLLALAASTGFWLLRTEAGASFAWSQAQSALGESLDGKLRGGDLFSGIVVDELRLDIGTAVITTAELRAALNIGLFPLQLIASGVHLEYLNVTMLPTESDEPLEIESVLTGLRLPFRFELNDATVNGIEVFAGPESEISIDTAFLALDWHEEIALRQLVVTQEKNSAAFEGRINLGGTQVADLKLQATFQSVAITAGLLADTETLQMDDITLSGAAIDANGSALLKWADGVVGSGSISMSRFEPSSYTAAWPAGHAVNGSTQFEFSDARVELSTGTVRLSGTDTEIGIAARWDRRLDTLSTDLDWQNLYWPLDKDVPNVTSRAGNLNLSGTPDDWQVAGQVAVSNRVVDEGQFEIDGGGDRDRLNLSIEEGSVFGGLLAGALQYSWRDEQAWSASFDVSEVRTAGIATDLPGVLSGQVDAEGTIEPLAVNVKLTGVDGVVLGDTLTAAGSIRWSDSVAVADALAITHGETVLFLDGSADTTAGMNFDLDIAAEKYSDVVSGQISANGIFSRQAPFLSLNLNSPFLSVGGFDITNVSISDQREADEAAGFVLGIGEVSNGSTLLTNVELDASVREEQQRVSLRGTSLGSNFELDLTGALRNFELSDDPHWQGELSHFAMDLEDEHSLRSVSAAPLEWSRTGVSIANLCIADVVDAGFCLDASRRSTGYLDIDANFDRVPLSIIEHVVTIEASFDQLVSGEITWLGNPDLAATGRGDITLTPGAISSSKQPDISVPTGNSVLQFEIVDGDFLSGTAVLPLPGVGGIEAHFEVPELVAMTDGEVSGFVDVDVTDIDALALFLPWVDDPEGVFQADLDVSGTVSKPLLTGTFAFHDGGLSYRPIGLELKEINLDGLLTENRAIEIEGSFRAGSGRGEVISSAEYLENERPGLRFKIRGENLTLVDVPDIKLRANPDFEVAFRQQRLDINGSLLIPSARLSPARLVESRVTESGDVVIVAGQRPEDPVRETRRSALTFGGELSIDLGDDVIVDLSVARATMSGGAVFRWQENPIPIVAGRYDVAGQINAFGQNLNITEGAILYSGVPAHQPYLRIRAEREIFGNSQVKRAGILVDGIAYRPSIEAYTSPHTTEERALTLLVTGSEFDYEKGIGAVDFGTYVAPRLFVSYGIGIFDRENIISARYDLTKGFGIKATSGEKESGVDLSYRIEN